MKHSDWQNLVTGLIIVYQQQNVEKYNFCSMVCSKFQKQIFYLLEKRTDQPGTVTDTAK